MRLHSLYIREAHSCGGILDDLEINFNRTQTESNHSLSPLCVLGPNGSGKSQFLQLLSEIFQAAWHIHRPRQERNSENSEVLFELVYDIVLNDKLTTRIRLKRDSATKPKDSIEMEEKIELDWVSISHEDEKYGERLPTSIIGYTSGDNETLSLPFFVSRAGYAKDVREAALKPETSKSIVPENRLLHVDYATHLEVLIANLLLGGTGTDEALLGHAGLNRLKSCRCILNLKPKSSVIKLTDELIKVIESLKSIATCWQLEKKAHTFTFDFFADVECKKGFAHNFETAELLYRSFHKLAMLNDLAISKSARDKFNRDVKSGQFAARLPVPQDEDKVFRFENVRLEKGKGEVDYVSLSDGEHQQAQIFGLFMMLNAPNTLFILDEPESHFNPLWRVEFVKRLLDLPGSKPQQEVILTSHAPFVASDISRENVLIFSKDDGKINVRKPEIETYGATFDKILEHCFGVRPPISAMARDEIEELKKDGNIEELEKSMTRLGSSVEKAILADRLRQLKSKE